MRDRQHGFSLLELLVVLMIIAVLAGLSVAWLDGGTRRGVGSAAERLHTDLERAALLAMERRRVVALRPWAEGYGFVTRDGAGEAWRALEDDALPARRWPAPMRLSREPAPPEDDDAPWLVWWPDAEVAGGRLTLQDDTRRRTLAVDALGVRDITGQDDG